ncbi:MAG: secretin N-terminal domain-containing protein [Planctomycetaceae bacterium]
MNTTLKQRWPRTRYVLISAIALLGQLLNVCTIIGQDAAPEDAVVDHAATPRIELNDTDKPSLNDLVDRLAAIEDSYRRFSIRWHETSETNPDKPAEFKPLWPNRANILLNYATSQIGAREWVDHREYYTNGVRTKWSQRFATEKGILSTNNEQLVSAAAMPFEADGRNEFLNPTPFEGIYALHDTGLKRSLISQRVHDNPGLTSLEWIDDDAKLTINFEDGPIRRRRVEIWLSHKHNWHPIRVRWFHPSSSKNVPFRHEWEVTVFEEIGGTFRVKAGMKRFPLDLRLLSNTSSIEARERLIKLADESEKRNETLPVAYTNQWVIDAAKYGDDVRAPLTWIEVDENPPPPEEFSNVASPAKEPDVLIDDAEIADRLLPLTLELDELRTKLGYSHPKVIALERRLAFTRDFLNKFAQESQKVRSSSDQIKIFNLKNSNATDAAQILRQLFNDVTVSLDNRTNALIVRATELQLHEIEAVLLRLDSTETAVKNSETTNQPSIDANTPVTSIAEYRRQLDVLEQPVLQLAEQVRASETKHGKDHPDSEKLRADLRALVQQTFAARQEIQRAELAEFTRRLHRMQQSIDARDRIADKVIDRRLEELLDPDANWEATTASTPSVSRDELVAILNQKAAGLKNWRCNNASVQLSVPGILPQRLSGTVACASPGHLRVSCDNFVATMDLGINSDTGWLYTKPADWVFTTAWNTFVGVPGIGEFQGWIIPSPMWMMTLLGVQPLDPERFELQIPTSDSTEAWLLATEEGSDGRLLRHIIKVDTVSSVIRSHTLYDGDGKPILVAHLGEYKAYGEFQLAHYLNLKFPSKSTVVEFKFADIETNSDLPDTLWQRPSNTLRMVEIDPGLTKEKLANPKTDYGQGKIDSPE